MNYFRIFAVLSKTDWQIRWTELGFFGSSLLEKHLQNIRTNFLKNISTKLKTIVTSIDQ
jgi:hypothetical protein